MAALLAERALRLEFEFAGAEAARELVEKQGLPRLFWVESEFRDRLRETELEFVRRLSVDIATGAWRARLVARHPRPGGDAGLGLAPAARRWPAPDDHEPFLTRPHASRDKRPMERSSRPPT